MLQIAAIRRTIDGLVEDLPSWQRRGDGKNLMDHRLQLIGGALVGAKDVLIIDARGMVVASSDKALANLNWMSTNISKQP